MTPSISDSTLFAILIGYGSLITTLIFWVLTGSKSLKGLDLNGAWTGYAFLILDGALFAPHLPWSEPEKGTVYGEQIFLFILLVALFLIASGFMRLLEGREQTYFNVD